MEDGGKIDLKWAKNMFYQILDDQGNRKQLLEQMRNVKTKNKVLKGYIHGVLAILDSKKRRYSYRAEDKSVNQRLYKIVRRMGDNRFLPDFEKGIFLAWKDYLSYLREKHQE